MKNDWKAWKTWHLPCLFSQRKFHIKFNHAIYYDVNPVVSKTFEKVSKKILKFFVDRSTCWNTLQDMDYLLNFFRRNRKVSNGMFSSGEKYYFLEEIKEYFAEGNCDAFDGSIFDMLSEQFSCYSVWII